jgi:hypothetical protein
MELVSGLYLVSVLLFTHFVADFMLQSSWMAINKSKSFLALGAHVSVYTVSLLLVGLVIFHHTTNFYLFVLTNGILHFITDYNTSRINAELYKRENKHDFFVMIGCDQFIHALCLIWTFYGFLT